MKTLIRRLHLWFLGGGEFDHTLQWLVLVTNDRIRRDVWRSVFGDPNVPAKQWVGLQALLNTEMDLDEYPIWRLESV